MRSQVAWSQIRQGLVNYGKHVGFFYGKHVGFFPENHLNASIIMLLVSSQ